jgi:hypothetical protein
MSHGTKDVPFENPKEFPDPDNIPAIPEQPGIPVEIPQRETVDVPLQVPDQPAHGS